MMLRKIQKIPLSYFKPLPIFSYHSHKLNYCPPITPPQYSTPTSLKDAIQDFYNILPSQSLDEETSKYILKLLAQGELYVDMLDFRKARKKYNEALRVSEEMFGKENTETALSLHRLGDLEQIEGAFEKSLELYTRAMNIFTRDSVGNGPFIASLNRSVGLWYKHTDENLKALGYLVKAVESLSSLEEYEKAETSLEFALGIANQETKVKADDKIRLYELAGDIYTQLGKLDLAEENLSKAMKLKSAKQNGRGYILLGFLRLKQDQVEDGIRYLEKGMKMCSTKRDKDTVIMARAYATLGYLQENEKNYTKALEYYQCSYDLFDKILKVREDIRLAKVLSYMGNVYFYLNETGKSLEYYEESVMIAERTKTSDLGFLATLYNNLGTVYAGLLENKLAAECYEKAVKYTEKLVEITDPLQLAFLHQKLGISYVNICKFENAKESLERALDIYSVKGEECSEETRTTQMLIEEVSKRTEGLQSVRIR